MTPMEVEALLKKLWENEWQLLSLVFGPGGDMWGAQAPPGKATRAGEVPGMSLRVDKMGEVGGECIDVSVPLCRLKRNFKYGPGEGMAPNRSKCNTDVGAGIDVFRSVSAKFRHRFMLQTCFKLAEKLTETS